jgi:hypothetical protein
MTALIKITESYIISFVELQTSASVGKLSATSSYTSSRGQKLAHPGIVRSLGRPAV